MSGETASYTHIHQLTDFRTCSQSELVAMEATCLKEMERLNLVMQSIQTDARADQLEALTMRTMINEARMQLIFIREKIGH